MLKDQLIAAVRTGVAALVGGVVAWLAVRGIDVPQETSLAIVTAAGALAASLYNVGVNWLASNVHPAFGYLLGSPKQASYDEFWSDERLEAFWEAVAEALEDREINP